MTTFEDKDGAGVLLRSLCHPEAKTRRKHAFSDFDTSVAFSREVPFHIHGITGRNAFAAMAAELVRGASPGVLQPL
jgi:hypothetical protein